MTVVDQLREVDVLDPDRQAEIDHRIAPPTAAEPHAP